MKSTVIKCDRCGKDYGLDEWPTVELRGEELHVQMYVVQGVEANRDYVRMNESRIDLCKECRAEFRQWFERRAVR